MAKDDEFEQFEIAGVTFTCIGALMTQPSPKSFGLRKTGWMAQRYRELAEEFKGGNLVELGIDKGASAAFLGLLFEPRRLVAFEIREQPVPAFMEFIDNHGLTERIRPYWGVDQADQSTVLRHVRAELDDQPLDLVIDDASHLQVQTMASFNALFPLVRPGGAYVIEDWSWNLTWELGMIEEITANPDGDLAKRLEAAGVDPLRPPPTDPLAVGALQLCLLAGYHPEIVTDIKLRRDWLELRRGPASLEPGFNVADMLPPGGHRILPSQVH